MKRMTMLATLICGLSAVDFAQATTYTFSDPNKFSAFSFDYAGGNITSKQRIAQFTTSTNITSAQFCFANDPCGLSGNTSYVAPEESIYTEYYPGGGVGVGIAYFFKNGTFENNGTYISYGASGPLQSGTDGAALTVGSPASAVPEPAVWTMMIFGFGLIGTTMRRRQQVAARVTSA